MNNQGIKISLNPVNIGLFLVEIVFIVFMIVSFNYVLNMGTPKLDLGVEGIEQDIDGLPGKGKEAIEHSIYQTVAMNSDSSSLQKSGVYVRESSLINNYYENIDVHYISFIADIPDEEQSYGVAYLWSDKEENEYISSDYSAVVFCLSDEQLIYGEFNCKEIKPYAKKDIVARLIRGNQYMIPGFDEIGIRFNSQTYKDDYMIRFSYLACGSQCSCVTVLEEKKEQAIRAFEEYYIYNLGLNKKEIPYRFDNCENQ